MKLVGLACRQAELRVDLIRHVEMSVLFPPTGFGSGEVLATFPLAGDLLDGRPFWASSVRLESGMYGIVVYERSGRGWREVARRRSRSHYYTAAVPVRIEPANAWIVAKGAVGRVPTWEVLRFDGESVHEELVRNWAAIMLFDVDLDGIFEILGEDICYRWCEGERVRSVGLYRWNGAEMTQVRLEALSAGSASDATVAANNRAVELAGAERFFATFPPYIDEYMDLLPSVRAAFDVTTAARTVAPALPEIEFLHGWAAHHLRAWADPSMELWTRWAWMVVDPPGESVALEALKRAAALAPHDRLFRGGAARHRGSGGHGARRRHAANVPSVRHRRGALHRAGLHRTARATRGFCGRPCDIMASVARAERHGASVGGGAGTGRI